ncbi:sulfatase [Haloarcula onubensis]|uniref:Sulfatase-like hydrolase/transferase n=1 Tax=Haloarcula onubensis TaxID=2950539 RepID=A0ABU2FNJ1_9EURY|nr:sulfatase [Halomicroarcula sp. S3CR25-11]MDS0281736.1 sulfatase-like hydrolase/transferase [Halomicroarcula sp. S3CR25-11]
MDNVLLVTIDSLRADHVGYHGYERDVTPNIDEYARQGSRFMNAHAHVGGTRFSFPSILTGVTPDMYGGHERVSDDQTLVSELFHDGGYRTGGFTCNLYVSDEFGYNRGWDAFFDSAPDESTTSKLRKWAKTNLDGALLDVLRKGYDYLESSQGINVGSYHVPADEMTDMAIEFIEQDNETPSFVWLHYMDVHHPFLPPAEYQREFRDDVVSDSDAIQLRRKFIEEPENVTDEEYQTFIDLYDAEILFNDAEVGRLMDTVEEQWGDDYVFALTADHGDHFLEHGFFGGARLRDVKTHVPLFVEGWDDDGEYDEMVGLADIPVTLADVAGFDIPDNYFGHSLRRLVFDGEWDRTAVFGSYEDGNDELHSHIRTAEWNLAVHEHDEDELYHLTEDPGEQENVVGQFPEDEAELRDRLDDHRQLVKSTERDDIVRPDMNEDVKERLRRLGYNE